VPLCRISRLRLALKIHFFLLPYCVLNTRRSDKGYLGEKYQILKEIICCYLQIILVITSLNALRKLPTALEWEVSRQPKRFGLLLTNKWPYYLAAVNDIIFVTVYTKSNVFARARQLIHVITNQSKYPVLKKYKISLSVR
jgi:hypothetical protein